MVALRGRDASERARKRAQAMDKKGAVKRLKEEKAAVVAERARVAEQCARLRLTAEAQQNEREAMDAARAFDVKDFLHVHGQQSTSLKNR